MSKLTNGTRVLFGYKDRHVECIITGIASDLPYGCLYILTVFEPDAGVAILSYDYPYESFVAHSSQFIEVVE